MYHPFGISWIHFSKILGTNLGNFVTDDDRWFGIFSKFTKTLNNFKQRHISLRGKSYVINCLTSSKLWYVGSTTLLPTHYLFQFNRVLFNFLWKSKSDPLNRNTVYLPFSKGGLNICNIEVKLQALYLKHIQFLVNDYSAKWCYFAKYWIGLSLRKHNKKLASLLCPHSDYIPPFYQQCLNALKLFEAKKTVICLVIFRLNRFTRPPWQMPFSHQ